MPGQTSDGQTVKYAGTDGQLICGALVSVSPGVPLIVGSLPVSPALQALGVPNALILAGGQDSAMTVTLASFATSNFAGGSTGKRSHGGTPQTPGSVVSGDVLLSLYGAGYLATGWSGNIVGIRYEAAEAFSDVAAGTRLTFFASPIGGVSRVQVWSIEPSGALLATQDNLADIGAVGATRPRRIYCGTALQVEGDGAAGVTSGLCLTNQTVAVGASAGTLTNAPAVGNPTVWLRLNINGAVKQFPGW